MTDLQSPDGKIAWTWRDVTKRVGLCRTTIEKLISRGEFPAPRKIPSVNKHLFDPDQVLAWWRAQGEAQS